MIPGRKIIRRSYNKVGIRRNNYVKIVIEKSDV